MSPTTFTIGGFFTSPEEVIGAATRLEQAGVDGMFSGDSQCLAIDPFVALTIAASVTEQLELSTGVTNPYTRHPAVLASAAASIQAFSRGRFTLGIGRGDSALAYVGAAPVSPSRLEAALVQIQGYLRGAAIELDPPSGDVRPIAELGSIGHAPETSSLRWLSSEQRKVPVEVMATGPRVIALAARLADRLTFSVGASEERLRAAIDLARGARVSAGLDPDALELGAHVSIVPHPNVDVARSLAAGAVASSARFSVMHGSPVSIAVDDDDRGVFERVRASYDMDRHDSPELSLGVLTAEFVDRYAVVGGVDLCVARLQRLASLGLSHFLTGRGRGEAVTNEDGVLSQRLLVEEVIPAVHAA